ncbi:MAG: M48 family metallopeptidase [bacterium]|nr:M48 family metallopeptidase [bacterium]
MTLYNQITSNRRRTTVLVVLFVVFIGVLGWFVGGVYGDSYAGLALAAVAICVMNLLAFFVGDKVALATAGAHAIEKKDNPYVYRLVENLCITAGIPIPKIYIIEDAAMNAFATGRNAEHASIAVTTGLIDGLENEELEGVIAHELSHIKNRDILVATLVVVLVGVVSLIGDFFLRMRIRGGRRSEGSAALVLVLVGLLLAILSPLIAKLIQFAISRQREYLADASGSLLTRYPEGLAKALEKIAANEQPMLKANHATAHLFFEDPFARRTSKGTLSYHLFSTHPPIEERIKRLRT